jgi:hypothetical protein
VDQEIDAPTEPLGKLIQRYRVEHATVIAHQRELERRRVAVHAAAARDASEIVVTARREIRDVLLRARQELATITAQVREAGFEAGAGESPQPIVGDDFHASAAREIRTALRDARSELAALSDETPSPGVSSPPPYEVSAAAADSSEQARAVDVVEQIAKHSRSALVGLGLVVFAVLSITFVALRPSSKTKVAASFSRSDSATPSTQESSSKAAAIEQADLNPAATRGSDVRPLKPASASGIAAATKPNAPAPAAVAKPAAAPPTPESPTRTATAADDATAERAILERHQRWFEAFNRGDRATMASFASDNFSLADERAAHGPAVSGRVERTIRDVRVRVTGVGAVLSGQIAETTTAGEVVPAAMLSEVWIRRGEEWQLVSARMVPVDAVPRTLQ